MTNNQNYDEKINILIQKGERASVIESQPIKSDKNSTMHPHNLSSVKHKFGIVLVETRKHNETVSSRIISLIQQIIKTQPDLPCELWLSSNSIINRNLQDFIDSHSTQIFVQYMPSKYTSTDSIYSIDLSSEHGGHIGKAMALRESKFLFPIFFNSDSWPCRNWFNVILNASLESDIIWSLAPIHFGASTNNNASASTTTFLEKNISQYENFRERNTETIFAVRKSSISYAWLTDALNIRAKMSVGSYQTMFRPFQDQAAFRESFFQYRFQLKEHLISSNIACWLTEKTTKYCSNCLCQCSSCLFVHEKSQFDKCAVQHNEIVKKSQFSDQNRFIFIAGLEGTGHHFFTSIFQSSRFFKIFDTDPIRCHLMRIDSKDQLFDLEKNSPMYKKKQDLIIDKLQSFSQNKYAFSLHVLNTHKESGIKCWTGMMSYPNGMDGTSWPDLPALAEIAERANIDLRIVVLTRSTIPMIKSVSKRFREQKRNIHLAELAARKLSAQLQKIDPAFYTCISYEDLYTINNDTLSRLQNFLVPKHAQSSFDFIMAVKSKLHKTKHNHFVQDQNTNQFEQVTIDNHRLLKICHSFL